jgi:hypothetical protein
MEQSASNRLQFRPHTSHGTDVFVWALYVCELWSADDSGGGPLRLRNTFGSCERTLSNAAQPVNTVECP